MDPEDPHKSAVREFVVVLFHCTSYIQRSRFVRTRLELQFLTCGEYKSTKFDLFIIDRDTGGINLVVQVAKHLVNPTDLYSQLIAKAIAMFQSNNVSRNKMGLAPLKSRVCVRWVITFLSIS
jgi:hypothetical protein